MSDSLRRHGLQHARLPYPSRTLGIYPKSCPLSAKWLHLCPTLCDPMDCSPPGSSVHGIFQARILEWVVTPTSRGSSWPRDVTCVSYLSWIGSRFFTTSTGSPTICLWKWKVLVAQLCPTLYDPIDYSLPGSSVHRILQAKILEWVAIPPSPGDLHNPGIIAGGF